MSKHKFGFNLNSSLNYNRNENNNGNNNLVNNNNQIGNFDILANLARDRRNIINLPNLQDSFEYTSQIFEIEGGDEQAEEERKDN